MKGRRWITALLTVAMLLGMAYIPWTDAVAIAPTETVAPDIDPVNDPDGKAFVDGNSVKLSQSGAWNLTVNVDTTKDGNVFALLLTYSTYASTYYRDDQIANIDSGNYASIAASNTTWYRSAAAESPNGGKNGLKLADWTLYNFNNNSSLKPGESSTTYHAKYALLIFDAVTDIKNRNSFTIVTFSMDSNGKLQTKSYMLRYQRNLYPAGYNAATDMPAYQIEGWGTSASVNGTTQPKRTGYTFLGWDANKTLMNADPNTAAGQTVRPQYPVGDEGPVSWATISGKFGTTEFDKDKDQFYDLYAVWRPNKVQFDLASAANTASVNGTNIHVLTLPEPQVGKAYQATISLGLQPTYTTDAGTAKGYSWPTEYIGKAITFGEESGTTVNLTTAHQLSVTAAKGTGENDKTQWCISGTPEAHSDGKPVYAVLQVKDNGNNTTDLIVLRFAEVKKGAQPKPTADVNTGLQSRVQTKGDDGAPLETPDGQIYGFYSSGAVLNAADGYTSDKDGTGTMTNWYLNMGMVFEYMPHMLKDADGNLQLFTGDTGWREVPFPETWYASLDDAGKADLTASMESGATKRIVSTKAGDTKATITASDGEAWPASYGSITFENGLPVIHGLHEDDVYLVRFRANDQYEVSDHREITIGGAVSGGGETPIASGGLAVNLAGGSEKEDPGGYSALKTAAKNLSADGELDLNVYDFEPTRESSAFLGWTLGERDTDGNLILYRADEPQTITVTWVDHDGTVLAGPTKMEVGGTVPAHPADPTREGYTFKEWTRSEDTEGNITFTATYTEVTEPTPEPTPGPEARDGEGEGTDPGGEEPPPAAVAAKWVDGLTGETILEGTTETEAPKKPFHSCYTAADAWTEVTGEDGTVTYTISYTRNTKVPMPEDLPASLAAVWQGGSSDPDMSKVRTITFYDWDGTTKLGVVAVQSGFKMAASDYAAMLEGRYDTTVMSLSGFTMTPTDDREGYVYNPGRADAETAMLTDKGGYTFSGWVPLDDEFSHYAAADADKMNAALIDWNEQVVTDHMDVKACYLANSLCGTEPSVRYTLEYETVERAGNNYTIRVAVSRYYSETATKFPMRMQDPILKVDVKPDGADSGISLAVNLDNKDYTSASFTFTNSLGEVQIVAADIYNQDDMATRAMTRSEAIILTKVDSSSAQNFTKFGTLQLMNESIRTTRFTATSISGFTSARLNDLGITASGSATNKLKKLLAAWRAANELTATSGPNGDGILDAADCTNITYAQAEAILNDKENVYLQNISFVDEDPRAEYIKGTFKWKQANVTDATVKTPGAVSTFKVYWSRDGITLGDPVDVTATDGVYSFTNSVKKQYYDRYLLVCAVDSSGTELPASAVIPVIDLAND